MLLNCVRSRIQLALSSAVAPLAPSPDERRAPVQVDEYKMYYAQSLFKAGLYEPAMKVRPPVACTGSGSGADFLVFE